VEDVDATYRDRDVATKISIQKKKWMRVGERRI
jgi:hypothetical protein